MFWNFEICCFESTLFQFETQKFDSKFHNCLLNTVSTSHASTQNSNINFKNLEV
jgi:hypothetical protein